MSKYESSRRTRYDFLFIEFDVTLTDDRKIGRAAANRPRRASAPGSSGQHDRRNGKMS